MSSATYSFIIVSYNTAAFTCAAVASVFRHTPIGQIEVIVIDNGSTDGSVEQLRSKFPPVRVAELGSNRGFAAANNAGARLATGRYLVLMNSDAEILPATLSGVEEMLERHPTTEVLGGQLLNPDGSLQTSLMLSNACRHFEAANQHVETVMVDSVVGAFMVIRRSVWEALNGMDEGFFFYFEESDFCKRVRARDGKVLWTPKFQVLHRGGGSSGYLNPKARVEYYTSLYHAVIKESAADAVRALQRRNFCKVAFNTAGNLLLCVLTLFLLPSLRARFATYFYLFRWHRAGCPTGWGLRRG